MHTQREHATYLHDRGAYYLLQVGGNQSTLFDTLDGMAWKQTPIGWMTYDRQEIRTIQVAPPPAAIDFPHVRQVFLLERHVWDLTGRPLRAEAILGITNLPASKADARRLTELARAEWSIENRDHHVRDVTFGEDRCRLHTGTRNPAGDPGRHAQPCHQRATPARLHQHRRSHPLGPRRFHEPTLAPTAVAG